MIEGMRTPSQMRDAVTVKGVELGHLLNALIQLRWTVEDAELGNEGEILRVISGVERTLLMNDGQLPKLQRDDFLNTLRVDAGLEQLDLVERIATLLS